MTVKISLLRKGSRGISATYENANHHAQSTVHLIKILETAITAYGNDYDFKWDQGNNIHLITRSDGSQLALRPFSNHHEWGIDVLAKFSRSQEMRLCSITNTHEANIFLLFLGEFLCYLENNYGEKEHKNNSRAE